MDGVEVAGEDPPIPDPLSQRIEGEHPEVGHRTLIRGSPSSEVAGTFTTVSTETGTSTGTGTRRSMTRSAGSAVESPPTWVLAQQDSKAR
ncbi:hypothetical protein GCM10009687_56250 [Asanoa iriomotensis]|uniref:Uncharacterized protein n=1 Tax=Asanoa iriomotensis TaxID=234613 RepID=A0ABQ4CFU1_9ACTN|nr:hypothetical protein Air01nite_77390 [Asanoa iriomotensis]